VIVSRAGAKSNVSDRTFIAAIAVAIACVHLGFDDVTRLEKEFDFK